MAKLLSDEVWVNYCELFILLT